MKLEQKLEALIRSVILYRSTSIGLFVMWLASEILVIVELWGQSIRPIHYVWMLAQGAGFILMAPGLKQIEALSTLTDKKFKTPKTKNIEELLNDLRRAGAKNKA